ncbi:hypothetical protein RQN30_04420 [Arcanobacterium hippocoleae]
MYCAVPEETEPTKTIPPVPAMRYRRDSSALAQMTTIRVGGKAAEVVNTGTREEFIEALKTADADKKNCSSLAEDQIFSQEILNSTG